MLKLTLRRRHSSYCGRISRQGAGIQPPEHRHNPPEHVLLPTRERSSVQERRSRTLLDGSEGGALCRDARAPAIRKAPPTFTESFEEHGSFPKRQTMRMGCFKRENEF